MQMVSPKHPCCTNAFDSPAEEEISAAITRQWVRLINRLEEQKEQASVTRQEAEE
jgi:hypothetical protein